jgi:predicted transposase/invertase (TIGR01784 family)
LKGQANRAFSDKLNFIFLQMPAFVKTETQLETHFDKWAFFLKNVESLDYIPKILKEPIFSKAFGVAEMAKMTVQQREAYQKSKLDYIGIQQIAETAEEEGILKGELRGMAKKEIEFVLELWKDNMPLPKIARYTNLSEEKIQAIIDNYQNQ